jgi:hypothetical protein
MRPPQINGSSPLRDFSLQKSRLLHTHFLLECFHPESHDLLMHVLLDQRPLPTSALWALGVSNYFAFFFLKYFHPKYTIVDVCPSRSLTATIHFISSGFGSFKLLCTHSSQSSFTQRQWISAMHPSGSDGPDLLAPTDFLSEC